MIQKYKFNMGCVLVTLYNKLAASEIFLSLTANEQYPISGFPRVFSQKEPRTRRELLSHSNTPLLTVSLHLDKRPFISGGSSRWAGRTPSQKIRKTWIAPSEALMLQRKDTISRYSERGYLVGDSDPRTLEHIQEQLTNGPWHQAELESNTETQRYEMWGTSFSLQDYRVCSPDSRPPERIGGQLVNGPSPHAGFESHQETERYEMWDTSHTAGIAELP